MDSKEKKDLEEVIRKETGRGRRPVDFETRKVRSQRLADMRKLLTLANKGEFTNAMRAAGLSDGSPEFEEALRIWSAYRP